MCSTLSKDFDIIDLTIGRSNIIPTKLCFDLNAFRNVKILKISGVPTENITDICKFFLLFIIIFCFLG